MVSSIQTITLTMNYGIKKEHESIASTSTINIISMVSHNKQTEHETAHCLVNLRTLYVYLRRVNNNCGGYAGNQIILMNWSSKIVEILKVEDIVPSFTCLELRFHRIVQIVSHLKVISCFEASYGTS